MVKKRIKEYVFNSFLAKNLREMFTFMASDSYGWLAGEEQIQLHLARHAVFMFGFCACTFLLITGKSIQNVCVPALTNFFIYQFIHKKTLGAMKFFALIVYLGAPMIRRFLVGDVTSLHEQAYIPFTPIIILLVTASYKLTSLCALLAFIFGRINARYIEDQYFKSPEAFEKTLQYFLYSNPILNFAIWISLFVLIYQRHTLLSQLLKRQQEKDDLYQQLQKKNEELERLYKGRTKLLLGLSHEFYNPINAALGNLELANEKIVDPLTKNYITNCKASIEMLFHLVSNLLDSTKLESRVLELNPLPKNSRDMFKKVWGIVKNLFDKHNLVGEFYIHRKIPKMLKVDSHFIVKILLNLILNSIKYTQKGAVTTVISWIDQNSYSEDSIEPSPGFLKMFLASFTNKKRGSPTRSVLDIQLNQSSGSETSDQDANNEFAIPFERPLHQHHFLTDNSLLVNQPSLELIDGFQMVSRYHDKLSNTKEEAKETGSPIRQMPDYHPNTGNNKGYMKIEVFDSGRGMHNTVKENLFQKFSSLFEEREDRLGLGLGLWLTKGLCEITGGQIRAFSEKDKGSQFVVLIPIEACCENALQPLEGPVPKLQRNQLRALVVDDDKYNREINTVFLTKAGVSVDAEALNGEEAVEIFRSKPPNYFDLIVMDLEMPVMTGKEAVRRIRKYERLHKRTPTKVAIATGNVDLTEYNECMDKKGDIQADFFYRKPLTKKDFEEFVKTVYKEKTEQLACLVIDQDKLVIEILQTYLKRHNINIVAVKSIDEAISLLKERSRFNLRWIFMDLTSESEVKSFIEFLMRRGFSQIFEKLIGYKGIYRANDWNAYTKLGIKRLLSCPLSRESIELSFGLGH